MVYLYGGRCRRVNLLRTLWWQKWTYICKKVNINLSLALYIKVNSKHVNHLYIKVKAIKQILKESIRKNIETRVEDNKL